MGLSMVVIGKLFTRGSHGYLHLLPSKYLLFVIVNLFIFSHVNINIYLE